MVNLTAALRILAEESYKKGAGYDIYVNLCQSSVSDAFLECIEAVYNNCFVLIGYLSLLSQRKNMK